jgi:hypothetical protein
MRVLWSRYRTAEAPADLDGLRERFNTVWTAIEGQQRRQGDAVLDWAAAMRQMVGKG